MMVATSKKDRSAWRSVFAGLLVLLLAACAGGTGTTPPAAGPTEPRATAPLATATALVEAPTATAAAATATGATESSTATPPPAPTGTASPTPEPAVTLDPLTWEGKTRPLLMVHYMPWYQTPSVSGMWGWHWTMDHFVPTQKEDGTWQNFASHYTPLTGLYDSNDPAVLEYQAQLMKLSGVDGVIVDWYGMEDFWDYGLLNASTGKLFQAIKKAGLKFAICYEDQSILHMVENGHLKKEDALAHGQKVMRYLQDTWFNDPAYLKAGGKPLLFIFGPQYFKSEEEWKALFSPLSAQPVFITLDGNSPGVEAGSYPWPPMSLSQGGVLAPDTAVSYLDEFNSKARSFGWKYLVSGAFPGFHDIYKEAGVSAGYGFLDAQSGRTFQRTLQAALNGKPDLIQLITWNDYGEGTNIEPTVEYGYRYLELVQEARRVTGAKDFSFTAEDLRLPIQIYSLRVKHAGDKNITAQLDQAAQALIRGDLKTARDILAKLS